ncbi:MAG: ferrous iron transport protein A [Anaerolineales bacterium]|nr:ferrous iron transport protein A [Anaerolineales bacterium]MCB0008943.1 ferrous iron transport protein A [Anaerolineales bacterium]MCB0028697.1 ferrous iron transport protein A [Anaerolineales bacterium]MCB8960606.1 ferrous iron transport protein A [Ardenticatenales bacterium]
MISLAQLEAGQVAQVVAIQSESQGRLLKLSAFGLVPGVFLKLQQRSPAYVLRIGETMVSLDAEVAREIQVRVEG